MKHLNIFFVVLALHSLAACSWFSRSPDKAFLTKSQEIISYLGDDKSKGPDSHLKLSKLALELLELSGPLVNEEKKKYPECKDFFDFIVNKIPEMKKLTLDQLEGQYHQGEALPEAPDICHEGKEFVVHPVTVYIIAQNPLNDLMRGEALNEITELIEHLLVSKE